MGDYDWWVSSMPTPYHGGKKFLMTAARIRRDIEEGHYVVGDKLPNPAKLGRDYDVSKPTMERALQVLKEDGWLVSYVGDGTYVQTRSGDQPMDEPTSEALLNRISKLYDAVERIEERLTSLEHQVTPHD